MKSNVEKFRQWANDTGTIDPEHPELVALFEDADKQLVDALKFPKTAFVVMTDSPDDCAVLHGIFADRDEAEAFMNEDPDNRHVEETSVKVGGDHGRQA